METGILILCVLLWIVCAVFLAAGLIFLAFRAERNQERKVGSVQNFDLRQRNFCYQVDKSSEQIRAVLSVPGNYQEYAYRFDPQEETIRITHALLRQTMKCLLILRPRENGTVLNVYRQEGNVPDRKLLYFMNPFWAAVLGAVPIPREDP